MTAIVKALTGGDEPFVVCQAAPDGKYLTHVQVYCPSFSAKSREYGLSFDVSSPELRQYVDVAMKTGEGYVFSRSLTGSPRVYVVMQVRAHDGVLVFQGAHPKQSILGQEFSVLNANSIANWIEQLIKEATC